MIFKHRTMNRTTVLIVELNIFIFIFSFPFSFCLIVTIKFTDDFFKDLSQRFLSKKAKKKRWIKLPRLSK